MGHGPSVIDEFFEWAEQSWPWADDKEQEGEMFVSVYKNKLSLCNTQRRRSEDTRFSHAADIRNTFDYLLSF